MVSTMSGGYVYLQVPHRKSEQIKDLLERYGISRDRIIPDLHLTVMYDPTNPTIEIDLLTDRITYVAWPIDFKMMGPSQTEYLTLAVESTSAEVLRSRLEAAGMVGTYPEFIPHISLIESPKGFEIEIVKNVSQNILNQCFALDGPFWAETKMDN